MKASHPARCRLPELQLARRAEIHSSIEALIAFVEVCPTLSQNGSLSWQVSIMFFSFCDLLNLYRRHDRVGICDVENAMKED